MMLMLAAFGGGINWHSMSPHLASSAPKCGVPRKAMANVFKYICWRCASALVCEAIRA